MTGDLLAQAYLPAPTSERKSRVVSARSLLRFLSLAAREVELLINSAISMAAIAYELGYTDPAHFTRAFKRWTQESPSEHRLRIVCDEPSLRSVYPIATGASSGVHVPAFRPRADRTTYLQSYPSSVILEFKPDAIH